MSDGNEIVETQVVDGEYVGVAGKPLTVHERFAANLRMLADWYEAHPEIEIPAGEIAFYIFPGGEENVPKVAHAMGKARKGTIGDAYFKLERFFGDKLILRACWTREAVCKRKVIGQRTVEREVPVGYRTEKTTEDVVEWECPKVMAPRELAEAAEQAGGE